MDPKRTVLPLAALAAAVALTALVLVALAPAPARAENVDVYELQQASATHGAAAVAIRADDLEALVLESLPGSYPGVYNDTMYKYVGGALLQIDGWNDQVWQFTCAAYDPSSTLALIGGTQGTVFSYSSGTLSRLSFPQPYADITAIDWHPKSSYALVGTSYSELYKYSAGSFTSLGYAYSSIDDIDFRPDGSEAALASYMYDYIWNTSTGSLNQLAEPQLDKEYYYYTHAVEYTRDGHYLYAAWAQNFGGADAILRYTPTSSKWEKVSTVSGQVKRMVFETEGSFLLIALKDGLYYTDGNWAQSAPGWGIEMGGGGVSDIAIDDKDFYFLFGTPSGLYEFVQKPNVKPWLKEDVPDVSFMEDDASGGVHLIDLLDYVTDDRNPLKLRFEFDSQSDPGDLLGEVVDGHFLNFVQKVPNWNGKAFFVVKVWDRGYDAIAGSADDLFNRTNLFNVTVRPVNDPISILRVGDKVVGQDTLLFNAEEGSTLNLTLYVYDVDVGETYRFSFNRSLPSMRVVPTADTHNWTLTFLPRNRDVGTILINLTVTDGAGSYDHVNLIFIVKNVNNPPRLMGIKDLTVLEDRWLNFTVWAVDEDLDIGMPETLTFSTNRTDGVGGDDLPNLAFVVDPQDFTRIRVSFLPTNDNVGEVDVEFRVRDNFAMQGSWDDVKTMIITVVNTNDAPRIIEVDGVAIGEVRVFPIQATEKQETDITILAHDDDRDPLTFFVNDARFKLEQTAGAPLARLVFKPTNDDVGNLSVVVSVWDDHNTFDEIALNVTVQNVNDAPVIVRFESMDARGVAQLSFSLWERQAFIAPIVVEDMDSDNITFSDSEALFTITVDPDNPHLATYAWTPGQKDVGVHLTIVQVDDMDGGKVTLSLTLTVQDINDPPVLPDELKQLSFVNPVSFQAPHATDPESDPLTYTWDFGDYSPVMTGDNLTSVTHTYARFGAYKLVLTVADGRGGEAHRSIDVLVQQSGEEPKAVQVQQGPIVLIAAITAVALVAAAAMVYLYSTSARNRGGGKA